MSPKLQAEAATVAEYCVNCLTSSELVHRDMMEHLKTVAVCDVKRFGRMYSTVLNYYDTGFLFRKLFFRVEAHVFVAHLRKGREREETYHLFIL
jgi:hypothetical protein